MTASVDFAIFPASMSSNPIKIHEKLPGQEAPDERRVQAVGPDAFPTPRGSTATGTPVPVGSGQNGQGTLSGGYDSRAGRPGHRRAEHLRGLLVPGCHRAPIQGAGLGRAGGGPAGPAGKAIATELSITPQEALEQTKGLEFLTAAEQSKPAYLGTEAAPGKLSTALQSTAEFLAELGQLEGKVEPQLFKDALAPQYVNAVAGG